MKKKQIRNLAIALSLTAALGTGATLAMLTAQTGEVTNTFTVGKNLQDSDLLLNEYQLNDDNRTANKDATRVTELGFTNLMQGDVMDKDPTVQINPEAAKCYMFVHVTGLDDLAAKGVKVEDWSASWVKYKADESKTDDGYYYYAGTGTENYVLDPSSGNLPDTKGHEDMNDGYGFKDLDALFTKVIVEDEAPIYNGNPVEGSNLGIIQAKACAVQAQNVDGIDDAFELIPGGF